MLAITRPASVFLLLVSLGVNLPAKVASGDEGSAIERFAEALRFETISHQDEALLDRVPFLEFHAFLERSFPRVHATLTREVVADLSLLYTWPGSDPDRLPILLTHHFDVVPVPPEQLDEWEQPPFSGVVADGYLWGRGALDDKAGFMAIFEAVESLLAEGHAPDRTVYLAFGHDEEVGGDHGAGATAALLESRGVRLEFTLDEGMVVLEGLMPGVEAPIALIGIAEKGYLTLRITAKAPGGHSSTPPPHTAIGRLARAVQRIEDHPMPARLEGPALLTLEALAPHGPFALRLALSQRWLLGGLLERELESSRATNAMLRTTTAVTMIEGGVKENVLPPTATATVNFRVIPGDTPESVTAHVRSVLDDPEIEIHEVRATSPSPMASVESGSYQAIAAAIRATLPATLVAPGLVLGGTDTKHYVRLAENSYRFTPMRLGQGDLGRVHGLNERISTENFGELIRFYRELLSSDLP